MYYYHLDGLKLNIFGIYSLLLAILYPQFFCLFTIFPLLCLFAIYFLHTLNRKTWWSGVTADSICGYIYFWSNHNLDFFKVNELLYFSKFPRLTALTFIKLCPLRPSLQLFLSVTQLQQGSPWSSLFPSIYI